MWLFFSLLFNCVKRIHGQFKMYSVKLRYIHFKQLAKTIPTVGKNLAVIFIKPFCFVSYRYLKLYTISFDIYIIYVMFSLRCANKFILTLRCTYSNFWILIQKVRYKIRLPNETFGERLFPKSRLFCLDLYFASSQHRSVGIGWEKEGSAFNYFPWIGGGLKLKNVWQGATPMF
jgi:hypothetical protein